MKKKDLTKDTDKKYNTTDLDPMKTFERHVFHRDQFAHYLRWSHVLKVTQNTQDLVLTDFGCGKGYLAEVLYRNRHKVALYQGLDIRKQTIDGNKKRLASCGWAEFRTGDLVKDDLTGLKPADIVCSFEVIEHVGKENAEKFLQNFRDVGKEEAIYYLSTPNYDERVGAAQNHIYNGKVNEFEHFELENILKNVGFEIVQKFGTFASQKDYVDLMTKEQKELFDNLSEYYDTNILAVIFAPLFPEKARNCLWVLKRKNNISA